MAEDVPGNCSALRPGEVAGVPIDYSAQRESGIFSAVLWLKCDDVRTWTSLTQRREGVDLGLADNRKRHSRCSFGTFFSRIRGCSSNNSDRGSSGVSGL